MVSVVEARVSTAQIAHQDSTGICAPSSSPTTSRSPHFGLDAGEALHQRDVAERVGGALGEIASSGARPRSACVSALRMHQRGERREDDATADQQQRRAAS